MYLLLPSRIITNAEEIAFYGGQDIELSALQKAYRALVRQSKSILRQKLWYVMLEQFLMKYGWAGMSSCVCTTVRVLSPPNPALCQALGWSSSPYRS